MENIQVTEFINLFVEPNKQQISLYDNQAEEIIYTGYIDEIPKDLEYLKYVTITSIDNFSGGNSITLNIDIDEEII